MKRICTFPFPGISGPYRSGVVICLIVLAAVMGPAAAVPARAAVPEGNIDFTMLSLEELKNVRITSASRRPEPIADVPAAVFVITDEDIRRSGATSIPELLRMVPGVQVARISATEWAVNMRGLNELFSNKLLVLIDGRSVYTHAFSGVFWDIQDTVLADIDRIEVIRGPGAALWGANAVNGVINIITKGAHRTQGGYLSLLGGTEEGIGVVRYGGVFGNDINYRIYTKYFGRGRLFENEEDIDNNLSKGDWRSARAGFRMDWSADDVSDLLTLQGEAYANRFDSEFERTILRPPFLVEEEETSRAAGGFLLGRWQHLLSGSSDTVVQFYYDHYDKDFDGVNIEAHVLDLDFQHRFEPFARHEIIWGLSGRYITDSFDDSLDISIEPDTYDQYLYSGFVQDRVEILPDRLTLTLGAKLEDTAYTGLEVLPSIRALWNFRKAHSVWGAVSRAVRVPSRIEHDAVVDVGVLPSEETGLDIPAVIQVTGEDGLDVEKLIAYELGYRYYASPRFWLNAAVFYHDYEELIGLRYEGELEPVNQLVPYVLAPVHYRNNLSGESWGLEAAAFFQPFPFWRLQGAYTFLETELHEETVGLEDGFQNFLLSQGSNPRNQISLRSMLDVTGEVEFDLWFRYVDRLSENDVENYTTLDARLAWNPSPSLELALVGQNLLEKRHSEFSSLEIERSFYVRMDWAF